MNNHTILRLPHVEGRTGLKRSAIYERVASGLFTRPVKLGARAVGWPSTEVDALVSATIAGKSKDQIQHIVLQLQAERLNAA